MTLQIRNKIFLEKFEKTDLFNSETTAKYIITEQDNVKKNITMEYWAGYYPTCFDIQYFLKIFFYSNGFYMGANNNANAGDKIYISLSEDICKRPDIAIPILETIIYALEGKIKFGKHQCYQNIPSLSDF